MREWVALNTAEDARLVKLLGLLVGPEASRRTMVSLEPIGQILDLTAISPRLESALQKPEWGEEDWRVLQLFAKALRAGGPTKEHADEK